MRLGGRFSAGVLRILRLPLGSSRLGDRWAIVYDEDRDTRLPKLTGYPRSTLEPGHSVAKILKGLA